MRDLKMSTYGDCLMFSGRLFHSAGAAAAKDLLPIFSNRHLGGVSWSFSVDRRMRAGVYGNSHSLHDDVIKWKHVPRYWPFVRRIHRSPVNSPHKGQWHGALMFFLNYVWINGWVNNHGAGDLRRYRDHYDVTVMYRYAGASPLGILNPILCFTGSQCRSTTNGVMWSYFRRFVMARAAWFWRFWS